MCRGASVYGVLAGLRATVDKSRLRKATGRIVNEAIVEPLETLATDNPVVRVVDGEQHIKVKLLGALDSITTAMVDKAKKGGTAPLRLLWELGKLERDATAKPRRREPSLSRLLMKELRNKEMVKKPLK
jgi:hypothetical protein